jgi:hypothetical protein
MLHTGMCGCDAQHVRNFIARAVAVVSRWLGWCALTPACVMAQQLYIQACLYPQACKSQVHGAHLEVATSLHRQQHLCSCSAVPLLRMTVAVCMCWAVTACSASIRKETGKFFCQRLVATPWFFCVELAVVLRVT